MTEAEIAERIIAAADTDRRRQVRNARPAGYGGYVLPYVHSAKDMNGWGHQPGDHLQKEDRDRHGVRRAEFWEGESTPNAAAITALEEVEQWFAELLKSDLQRRALWAWAHSKVGGQPFDRWCRRVEEIDPETGRDRKKRAIAGILRGVVGRPSQHGVGSEEAPLGNTPEIEDKTPTLGDDRVTVKGIAIWQDDWSFRPEDDPSKRDLSWARERNERRRRRAMADDAEGRLKKTG